MTPSVQCHMLFALVTLVLTPLYLQRAATAAASNRRLYLRTENLDAIDWLKNHAREQDAILSNYAMGTKLGQLVPARVVLGHWALTPHVDALGRRVDQLLDGGLPPAEATTEAAWL